MTKVMVKEARVQESQESQESRVIDWHGNTPLLITEDDWQLIERQCPPIYIYLCITNRCNMPCKFCYMSNKDGSFPFDEMSLENIDRCLQKVGKNHKILLFGGEPTVREDIFEIIHMIRKSGNIPMLYTNGIRLAELAYVKRLAKAGIRRVCLSLDSLSESTTASLRGDENYLHIKLKAVENLKRIGAIKVWLTPLIYQGNIGEIENIINFVISNKEVIKGLIFIAYKPWGRYENFAQEEMSLSELMGRLDKVTNGVLNNEYFSEFSRLRKNLNYLLSKLKGSLSLNTHSVLCKIDKGELSQLIFTEELKEINNCLEEGQFFSLLKYIYRNKKGLTLIKNIIFNLTSTAFEIYGRDTLNIVVARLISPLEIMTKLRNHEGEMIGIGLRGGNYFVCIAKGTPY